MNVQNFVFIISEVFFILLTITFVIRYSKLLVLAQKEYEKAKNIIKGILLTFKTRLDRQDQTIDQLTLQMEQSHSVIERVMNSFQEVEKKVKELTPIPELSTTTEREVKNRVNTLKKEVDIISENQQNLESQLVTLIEKIQGLDKKEKILTVIENGQTISKLTETERTILNLLKNEGVRSAPEVEKQIGKTREHTARLMKKLWQEGYIERDTHRIPYVYHITENLKTIELKDLTSH